jgi:hypothetical protein
VRKSLLFLFVSCIILFSRVSYAQTYSNSWINYSQHYYKFKILVDQQICQIPYSVLSAAGLGAVTGNEFQLFKNGKEVPVYVTTQGTLGAGDYIY